MSITQDTLQSWFKDPNIVPRLVRAAVEVRSTDDGAAVRARLAAHTGQGWVSTTDEVAWLGTGDLPLGPVLAADLCLDEAHSLQVTEQGGTWTLVTVTEGEGTQAVAIDTTRLAIEEDATLPRKTLRYRVYWRPREQNGVEVWQPAFARFLGWEE